MIYADLTKLQNLLIRSQIIIQNASLSNVNKAVHYNSHLAGPTVLKTDRLAYLPIFLSGFGILKCSACTDDMHAVSFSQHYDILVDTF